MLHKQKGWSVTGGNSAQTIISIVLCTYLSATNLISCRSQRRRIAIVHTYIELRFIAEDKMSFCHSWTVWKKTQMRWYSVCTITFFFKTFVGDLRVNAKLSRTSSLKRLSRHSVGQTNLSIGDNSSRSSSLKRLSRHSVGQTNISIGNNSTPVIVPNMMIFLTPLNSRH